MVIRRYHLLLVLLLSLSLSVVEKFSIGSEFHPQHLITKFTRHLTWSEQDKIKFDTQNKQRYVAITFDDGPYPRFTEQLLGILSKENVKATFFVIGEHVVKYPELLKLITENGHEVAGHTYTHPTLSRLDYATVKQELEATRLAIVSAGGSDTFFFRPPGGQYNEIVRKVAKEYGYRMVLWTIIPADHERPAPEVLVDRINLQIDENEIVLLHQGVDKTVTALPQIIRAFKNKGYLFVTVSDYYSYYQLQNKPKKISWLFSLTHTDSLLFYP